MDSSLELVDKLLAEGEHFTFKNFSSRNDSVYGGEDTPEWLAWKTRSANLIRQLMSENSPSVQVVNDALSTHTKGFHGTAFERVKSSILKALRLTKDTLTEDVYGELRVAASRASSPALSNKVFVVHGHDHALKTDIERFLRELHLEPIVLHRQPDRGRTLIEKFEEHSDVGYAFILLTPDDISYAADQEILADSAREKERRARQNVIFEFGYFVGKLGRDRVCCIFKAGVTLPTDLAGLVYKEVAETIETQAFSILRELKAAGYRLNL